MIVSNMSRTAVAGASLLVIASTASAIPQLQLGIVGGTYDTTTQTIISAGDVFALYAFLKEGTFDQGGGNKDLSLTDLVYVSAALVPKGTPSGNYGFIKINGEQIDVTSEMIFGTPPLDTATTADGASLGDHGIFATYFYQTAGFSFTGATQYNDLNTADDPDLSGLTLGTGMYGVKFMIDVSGLADGLTIHFDLYNSELAKCVGQDARNGCPIDYDAVAFAPFSHDAQSSSTSSGIISTSSGPIPSPGTNSLALLGLGLVAGSFLMRRKGATRA